MPYAVELVGVEKSFPRTEGYRDIATFWRRRKVHALRGVDLTVPQGGSFGILGANGAGKTTLLKVLAGLMLANRGTVRIGGVDVTDGSGKGPLPLMYVSGEERTHYMRLTGRQNLDFYADLFDVPHKKKRRRIDELLELVGLQGAGNELVVKYSTGMKQRLAIARGLMANPEILLLDEPTRSLDPAGARHIWSFIRQRLIDVQHKTVIVATHDMEEAAVLCDRVAIISDGRIVVNENVGALQATFDHESRFVVELSAPPNGVLAKLEAISGLTGTESLRGPGGESHVVRFTLSEPAEQMKHVLDVLSRDETGVLQIRRVQASLGDVVSALSGRTDQ